jgi:hypothetical protein
MSVSNARRTVANPAATSLEPLRIRVPEHRQALALSSELTELGTVEIVDGTGVWEVHLHGPKANGVIVKVLEAVRRTLAGAPAASAEILLDGRRHHMDGE